MCTSLSQCVCVYLSVFLCLSVCVHLSHCKVFEFVKMVGLLRLGIFFFFGSFFSELGTEPRALCFLGKRSTTELNPQPLFSSFFDLEYFIV